MAAKNLLANFQDGVILIPLPPSIIEMFGCRPGTAIRAQVVDGEIMLPLEPVSVIGNTSLPGVGNTWENCSRWWKARGSNPE